MLNIVIREMPIKILMRCHFTKVNIVLFLFFKENNKCLQSCGEIGTLVHFWWGCVMFQSLYKRVQLFLKQLTLDYHMTQQFHSYVYAQKSRKWILKFKHTHVQSSMNHNRPNVESAQVATIKWINKLWYMHAMGYYSALKRNEVLTSAMRWIKSRMLCQVKEAKGLPWWANG